MKPDKSYTWHKIASAESDLIFNANHIAVIEIDSKKICIARYQNGLFGIPLKCPHAGGLLSEGYVDALGNIVCPVHRYKYNLRNGYNSSGEGFYLKTYPVQVKENGIFVGLEEGW